MRYNKIVVWGQGWFPTAEDYQPMDMERAQVWLTERGWSEGIAERRENLQRFYSPLGGYILLPLDGCQDALRFWAEAFDCACRIEGIVGRERWSVLDAWSKEEARIGLR